MWGGLVDLLPASQLSSPVNPTQGECLGTLDPPGYPLGTCNGPLHTHLLTRGCDFSAKNRLMSHPRTPECGLSVWYGAITSCLCMPRCVGRPQRPG